MERTRIAPTPSGHLHAGNAASFLLTRLLADRYGARLRLRIDDLDADRTRTAYLEDIFETLHWLGISWEDGPRDVTDHVTNCSQRLRIPVYTTLLNELRHRGHLYGCSCSRRTIALQGGHGRYPGTCRDRGLDLDRPGIAWRLRVPQGTRIDIPPLLGLGERVQLDAAMGDPVLRRADGHPAYQVASLADDVDHGITFIVRGVDLLPSTACQLYMARLLGLGPFLNVRFAHHDLLTDEVGVKLSKSAGATSVCALRQRGSTPDALRERALELLRSLEG